MVTGAAGHHGVCATLNVDLERKRERGHVTTPRQGIKGKLALEVQTVRKCAKWSLVELVGRLNMTKRTCDCFVGFYHTSSARGIFASFRSEKMLTIHGHSGCLLRPPTPAIETAIETVTSLATPESDWPATVDAAVTSPRHQTDEGRWRPIKCPFRICERIREIISW